MKTSKPANIDAYIVAFPEEVQKMLEQIRHTIRKAAPDAEETIKYDIPTFTLKGNLFYFAAFKNHIGFYAAPTGNEAFREELKPYKTGRGSIQFPLSKLIPLDLISRIVQFRVQENLEKADKRKKTHTP